MDNSPNNQSQNSKPNEQPNERIAKVIQQVRPFLQVDGGDLEFVHYDEEHGVIEIRLTGNCVGCAMSVMTLRAGIEAAFLRAMPEIKRIESVSA